MSKHAELRKRLAAARDLEKTQVKSIVFSLPDLKGPGGNAFSLLAEADRLMVREGLGVTVLARFRSEATQGDYQHLLRTIQEWFTVAVADVTYVPLGDTDITSLAPGGDPDIATWDDYDASTSLEGEVVDKAMDEYEMTAEETRRLADAQERINREVRQDLGLTDDEVVIVQIKKRKG